MDMEIDDTVTSDSDEYEDYLLFVDIDPASLAASQIETAEMKIFGLETKKPLLQVNNHFFEGEFDFSMGTHLFFEENKQQPVDELYAKCKKYYTIAGKTNKVLKMSRVLIKDNSIETGNSVEREDDGLTVERNYQDALGLFLEGGRNAPRKIAEEYNCDHLLVASQIEDLNLKTDAKDIASKTSATSTIDQQDNK